MTLVTGRALCARCRGLVDLGDEQCAVCDASVPHRVWSPVIAPLQGVVDASAGRRALSVGISCLVALAFAALCGLLAGAGGTVIAGASAAAGGALAVVVGLVAWRATGRAPGDVATGIRWVRPDGTPPGSFADASSLVAALLTPQRDPARLSLAPLPALPVTAATALVGVDGGAMTIVLDDGTRVALRRAAVLGRRPAPSRGEQAVALPDLSRRISKEHVRLERDGAAVYATDLGSTNGTEVVRDGRVTLLEPHVRVAVPPGATLLVAGRGVRIEHGDVRR